MASSLVNVTRRDDATAVVTLNRPNKRNALNIELMETLCSELHSLANEPRQRVVILRAAGPVFCAGLDLLEASDQQKAETSAQWVAKTFKTFVESPLITIAAAHGACVAGGAGLMGACDFAVAAEDLTIRFPEVRRGLVPALIAAVIGRQMGSAQLRELFILAEPLSAGRAASLGLVHRVAAPDRMMDEAFDLADTILKAAPRATANTKQLLFEISQPTVSELLDRAVDLHLKARNSDEAKEGIRAFHERREAVW